LKRMEYLKKSNETLKSLISYFTAVFVLASC